jgi:DNA-binding response OmpR family regulator
MRLLLAEDEAALSRALKTLLENEGYEVHIANDGIEALQLVEEHIYDIMILDIMMPRLDGISTLKKIREMQISTPAIFLTAKGEVEDRVSGLEVGADDYLCKPFAIKELMARLHALHRRNNQKRMH